MIWQEVNSMTDEDNKNEDPGPIFVNTIQDRRLNQIQQQNYEKKMLQLQKHQDSALDSLRTALSSLVDTFSNLLLLGKTKEIVENLLTKNSQIFLFDSTGRIPVRYSTPTRDFSDLYKEMVIQKRTVLETQIDTEQKTVCQTCQCLILFGENTSASEEITCEIFTIKISSLVNTKYHLLIYSLHTI